MILASVATKPAFARRSPTRRRGHTAIRTNGSSCDRRTAATLTIATSASNTSSDRLRRCTPSPLITLRATAAPRPRSWPSRACSFSGNAAPSQVRLRNRGPLPAKCLLVSLHPFRGPVAVVVARPVAAAAWDTAVVSVACSCGGLRQLQRHERQDVGAVGGTGFPTHEITTLNS